MPTAVGQRVWIIRDKTEAEKGGLIIPGSGREKPNTGTVVSIGQLVKDPAVKHGKGKKAIFPKTVGQEIEYNGTVYLVVFEHEIWGFD